MCTKTKLLKPSILTFSLEINNLDTDESLQEYKVKTTDDHGKPVPKLRSIVLAIDSNWGAEYSCLYRFRVHNI